MALELGIYRPFMPPIFKITIGRDGSKSASCFALLGLSAMNSGKADRSYLLIGSMGGGVLHYSLQGLQARWSQALPHSGWSNMA